MIKLGKYTRTIYDKDYDFSKCPECCVNLDDKISEEEFDKVLLRNLLECVTCLGCPAAIKDTYRR